MLKGTLAPTTMTWVGIPSTRSCLPKLHPTWPWTLGKISSDPGYWWTSIFFQTYPVHCSEIIKFLWPVCYWAYLLWSYHNWRFFTILPPCGPIRPHAFDMLRESFTISTRYEHILPGALQILFKVVFFLFPAYIWVLFFFLTLQIFIIGMIFISYILTFSLW